ncbi:hypothetical protein BO86DRAFT_396757 [Aspergillus japonicus CBS 114.51]|uniref:F-box domain-containing protein n=1 Tax=Aspergillus japonicus CBS 114.51 TaxID=1448312 RepID=A0A8T8XCI5_ASPJA|nr:hypothetical protein BO86DRAFT_396757 [Aspergillus japonicus CBS 114.51]RAH85132.1 hypothetical protein BO86DRAFT_396757 [Aspergillus japonicus CBS 114.51]
MPTFARGSRSPDYESRPNRLMSNSQASKIFDAPETLERILLGLDIYTLLVSARVCHTWSTPIKFSRKIQQALFYIPVETPAPHHPTHQEPAYHRHNMARVHPPATAIVHQTRSRLLCRALRDSRHGVEKARSSVSPPGGQLAEHAAPAAAQLVLSVPGT